MRAWSERVDAGLTLHWLYLDYCSGYGAMRSTNQVPADLVMLFGFHSFSANPIRCQPTYLCCIDVAPFINCAKQG